MNQATLRPTIGFAAVGLFLGLVLFSLAYLTTVRSRVAVRGDPAWAALFLALLVGPAVVLAWYGWWKYKPKPAL